MGTTALANLPELQVQPELSVTLTVRLSRADREHIESFARWLEEAGVPPSRIRAYMGHRPQSVTDLYQRHDVEPYLVQDAKLMRRWIRQHGGQLRVVGGSA